MSATVVASTPRSRKRRRASWAIVNSRARRYAGLLVGRPRGDLASPLVPSRTITTLPDRAHSQATCDFIIWHTVPLNDTFEPIGVGRCEGGPDMTKEFEGKTAIV